MAEAVILRGPIGVGKTATAGAVNDLLIAADVPHAVLDLDWLCAGWPHFGPWNEDVLMPNLRSVAREFRARGSARFVLAGVVESHAHMQRLAGALEVQCVKVCGLRASLTTIEARLRCRDTGARLERHLARAAELTAQFADDGLDDFVIDTDGKEHHVVAQELVSRLQWITATDSE